jgi:hypothetical protein
MSLGRCSLAECTLAVTGVCVLSHSPPSACPNFANDANNEAELGGVSGTKTQQSELKSRTLSVGNELGTHELSTLMARRYGTVIGVLGETGTGKTCLLSALYLLASIGELRAGLAFGGSSTLVGFEQRLRLLRGWEGVGLPDQLVEHTILADPRRPGFVHLAFVDTSSAKTHDLFFSDLPGEWTTDLIKRASTANRFSFLRRVDVILIAVQAPSLLRDEQRHNEVQSARILLQRLRNAIGVDQRIPLVFAITRCDLVGQALPSAAYEIVAAAQDFGFANTSIVPVAAFSAREDVPSGFGLGDLMEAILGPSPVKRAIQSEIESQSHSRMFARFRLGV